MIKKQSKESVIAPFSVVKIRTDLINADTNDPSISGLRHGALFPFQLGVVIRKRDNERRGSSTSYDVLTKFTDFGVSSISIPATFVEPFIDDLNSEDCLLDFVIANILEEDLEFLPEASRIYPEKERINHTDLNEVSEVELIQFYSYSDLRKHLIKALLCLQSTEQRVKSILRLKPESEPIQDNESSTKNNGTSDKSLKTQRMEDIIRKTNDKLADVFDRPRKRAEFGQFITPGDSANTIYGNFIDFSDKSYIAAEPSEPSQTE